MSPLPAPRNKPGPKRKSLIGQRFACLTVTEFSHSAPNYIGVWVCRCDCGNKTLVYGNNLTQGRMKSCGHLRREYLRVKRHEHYDVEAEDETGMIDEEVGEW